MKDIKWQVTKIRSGKSHEKLRFKLFFVHTKMTSRPFQIPPIDFSFRKALFSRQTSVDGRPNCKKKAAFSHFSGVVWTICTQAKMVLFRIDTTCGLSEGMTPVGTCYLDCLLTKISLWWQNPIIGIRTGSQVGREIGTTCLSSAQLPQVFDEGPFGQGS